MTAPGSLAIIFLVLSLLSLCWKRSQAHTSMYPSITIIVSTMIKEGLLFDDTRFMLPLVLEDTSPLDLVRLNY